MARLTKAELVAQIDWERRENNSVFISPTQTTSLMNRAINRVLREPGIRTVNASFPITAQGGISRYALPDDFKQVIQLSSGQGGASPIPFQYLPEDEFNMVVSGFCYTFKIPGFIDIKFPDVNTLPTTTITLDYWSLNIILDVDGITFKRKWENDGDTSRLLESFDDFYIMWPLARVLRREGKKEWKDYEADGLITLEMLKEQPGAMSTRPRKAFGMG